MSSLQQQILYMVASLLLQEGFGSQGVDDGSKAGARYLNALVVGNLYRDSALELLK